jgi:hypothetical protein
MDLKAFRAQALKELGPLAETVAAAKKRVDELEAGLAQEQALAAAGQAALENPANLGSVDALRVATAKLEEHREAAKMLTEKLLPVAWGERGKAVRTLTLAARDFFGTAQRQCFLDVRKLLDAVNTAQNDFLQAASDVATEIGPNVDYREGLCQMTRF